ncbi:hypothetical protein KAR91_29170 [Candidatus Pacearchaeota archaeon]|nr:hypothetical protein [Candidatus Pacearchaeota archaeon]
MKITETNIPDFNPVNINNTKEEFANKIIQRIYPLFDDVLSDKISEVTLLTKQLEDKRQQVLEDKHHLEVFISAYNKKKKIKQLLERVNKLVSSGLIHDGAMRSETIVLLKIVDKLPEDKLTYHLNETMRVVAKRF